MEATINYADYVRFTSKPITRDTMKIKIDRKVPIQTTPNSVELMLLAPVPEPVIDVSFGEVDDRTFGLTVAEVNVKKDENVARFWVSLRIKNGRPVMEVTTKVGKDKKEVVKQLQGSFNIAQKVG